MTKIDIEPWEPEETVGKLWHTLASRLDVTAEHDGARVDLAEVEGRLAVFYRGLGGSPEVDLRPVDAEESRHRLSFRRRLATEAERVPRASFDGETLRLPASLAVFHDREANVALYLWLAALAPHLCPPPRHDDLLRADIAAIMAAMAATMRTLVEAPGLAGLQRDLCRACLADRPTRRLPPVETAVEDLVRHVLGDRRPLSSLAASMLVACRTGDLTALRAPRGYRPFRPAPLWIDCRERANSATNEDEAPPDGGPAEDGASGVKRARRHRSEEADRKDSLILHKFEAILSWTEFLNLNRRVDDDDTDNAKKAADDQEEIGLGQVSKSPATRLKLHLDLAPEDAEREALSATHTYPEWDARTGTYLPAHVRVLESMAEPDDAAPLGDDPQAARRIRSVKRQFEALRPGRMMTAGHLDGDELDTDMAVRASTDRLATGIANERVWRQSRPQARSLSVSILLDVSRSTESAVSGRQVIDIEREALAALAWGLDACGDDFAIHAFSSLKRNRVYLLGCKDFGEPMGATVEARIRSLKPGFYTRLGAAIRHASAGLAEQAKKRRLLLVITDGKPNDLDHYEGRHGIEDSAMAVREARRAGHAVFGITVDRDARSWFPRIFGRGGYAQISHPDRLTAALPEIYRHLVGA
ncbi:nitric oxide reductase NorD protein [Rhodobium orientis]|uniref:Nitric oxide reductase D protein n=1 Tax=Rhodobium orientis TaxID=34017 RepID=A0A327JR19_9HYPH|nr:VWA domain-containing protein [Rhodobium orientis]MBB4303278.1 nitric oxide reductase NorD protein [Rhodobium orientis]MBK5951623.1 nitric oxide reductase D protein [Rhodobium orientis]RAI27853.1 nitric oxide reductase D protein [Rhodobium orientis]